MDKDDYLAGEAKESETKSKNITIRVTPELRTTAYDLWNRHFGELAFNQFLAHMVKLGLQESELRIKEAADRNSRRMNDSANHQRRDEKIS